MQTTLRIDDALYREAKAEAARHGVTITRFIEDALRQRLNGQLNEDTVLQAEIVERNQLIEALLQRTDHFRVGSKPNREEMNER